MAAILRRQATALRHLHCKLAAACNSQSVIDLPRDCFGQQTLRTDRTADASPSPGSGSKRVEALGVLLAVFRSTLPSASALTATAGLHYRSFTTSLQAAEPSKLGGRNSANNVHPLWNWPNAISGARLLSGPFVAYLILNSHWHAAFLTLGISGISDWLDGFVARRYNQGSVVGSYLDPLADKALICCTAGALAYEGSLYPPLAMLIIGRDIFLVAGTFMYRMKSLHWRWPGWSEFFRTTSLDTLTQSPSGAKLGGARAAVEPAPFVQPLYISKVNTVAQLSLVAVCITSSWYGWPPEAALWSLGGITGGLTFASGLAYWQQYSSGMNQSSRKL